VAEWLKAAVLKTVTRHLPANPVYVRKSFYILRVHCSGNDFGSVKREHEMTGEAAHAVTIRSQEALIQSGAACLY
jgi:hypothetical protein